MALGFGANARPLAAFEATYGSPPTDNYHRLGFSRYGLSARQQLIDNDLLGELVEKLRDVGVARDEARTAIATLVRTPIRAEATRQAALEGYRSGVDQTSRAEEILRGRVVESAEAQARAAFQAELAAQSARRLAEAEAQGTAAVQQAEVAERSLAATRDARAALSLATGARRAAPGIDRGDDACHRSAGCRRARAAVGARAAHGVERSRYLRARGAGCASQRSLTASGSGTGHRAREAHAVYARAVGRGR